jgi:hypothetical protein
MIALFISIFLSTATGTMPAPVPLLPDAPRQTAFLFSGQIQFFDIPKRKGGRK